MKSPEQGNTQSFSEMVTREEISIPEGTLLPNREAALRGSPLIGVTQMSNTILRENEIHNYFPQKDWPKITEGTPTTSIFIEGMRGKRMIVVEKRSLTSFEINEIIRFYFQIDLLDQYINLIEKTIHSTTELNLETGYSRDNFKNTTDADPIVFLRNAFTEGGVMGLDVLYFERQLEALGILTRQMQTGVEAAKKSINNIIAQLDQLKVLAIQNVGAITGQMWWPIKKFIAEPYGSEEKIPRKYLPQGQIWRN